MWTNDDLQQINNKKISLEEINSQIEKFKKGTTCVNLERYATVNDGIFSFSSDEEQDLLAVFDNSTHSKIKFVPASGGATRMFSPLYYLLENFNPKVEKLYSFLEKKGNYQLKFFIENYQDFPFSDRIIKALEENMEGFSGMEEEQKAYHFIKYLLLENGLNYGESPKGLIPFQEKDGEEITPLERHFEEAKAYASAENIAKLHFTVAPNHLEKFKVAVEKAKRKFSDDTFEVSFSVQDSNSNTIAVNKENMPFRTSNNHLVFRPGGHGALLKNLNQLQEDIVFIKNIDNVSNDYNFPTLVYYKKLIGGLLVKAQGEIFEALHLLEKDELEGLAKAEEVLQTYFNIDKSFSVKEAFDFLNRPLRVCGMVKNEGEPGGGPFWVKDQNGIPKLQIIESAQIHKEDAEQAKIAQQATHFNPVDLVCSIKDYKGKKFDLVNYVNHDKYFISEKFKKGKVLKALELPGLWNGSMELWNSIFVEVPITTFNPVKTVNDLLKSSHKN
ncbi:DUF4301 family protein [Mesonia sp. K7]|uniref:DUF4301 family protein n=1 Tax=Mesonia sp. K7 TaxID=2218606 RepID=UPI000DA7BB2A|nr:DUF4301 family protein [Mesonia sp. K7]PZD78942.1 DUF4301 domain-containing protein [Mesonia sp. K7]